MDKQTSKIIEVAQDLLRANGYYVEQLWHVDDIHFICEQNNITRISDEEAMEVFSVATQQFDGERGISWPQLEKALHTYLHRKAVLNNMCKSEA